MKEVAKLQVNDRSELFHDCKYKNAFVFKGGTSLSKSYHVIERFSEDIDLILDWRKIINDEGNPWEERTKTKQDLFNKQINSKAANFYKEELIPQLNTIVTPFVADKYPDVFLQKETSVLTIDVERTFWEKLTILHKIANFPEGKTLPSRYARHLYDVYNLGNSWVKESAFERKESLIEMIETYIDYYNTKRLQRNLGVLTPMEKHLLSLAA